MSRPKSQFLSSLGVLFELFKAVTDRVLEKGGSDEDIARIGKDPELAEGIAKMILASCAETKPYKIAFIVESSRTLKKMIVDGRYDGGSSGIIAEEFPIEATGKQEVVLELLHFNRRISTEDALIEIERRGLEPAKFIHLLAFGKHHPELQLQFSIVALGSVLPPLGGFRVPCLNACSGRRCLILEWGDCVWDENYRFLVVHKS